MVAYSTLPNPLAVFRGFTLMKRREGKRRGGRKKWEEKKRGGRARIEMMFSLNQNPYSFKAGQIVTYWRCIKLRNGRSSLTGGV